MAQPFIEVTDTSINKKVLIGVDWIKAVYPNPNNEETACKTAILVGDGYPVPIGEGQPERFDVAEVYGAVRDLIMKVS